MDPATIALPGFDPYADVPPDTGLFGIGKIVKKVAKASVSAVKSVGKAAQSAAKSQVAKVVVPLAQQQLRQAGPWGMAGAAALGAMHSGLKGERVDKIGIAAVKGATPDAAHKAIDAADALRRGEPVLKVALENAHMSFEGGSPEKLGFASAIRALKAGAGRAELGEMRRAQASEGARRAFDAAIGTVAEAVERGAVRRRPRAKAKIGSLRPRLRSLNPRLDAVKARLEKNPGLRGLSPATLAKQLRTTPRLAATALSSQRAFRFAPLSPWGAQFVKRIARAAPMFALTGDTGALEGNVYVVEPGDSPSRIAQKLTGSANRWPELVRANPNKAVEKTGPNKGSFKTLFAGERLTLPAGWVTATALPAPTVPPLVVPSSLPPLLPSPAPTPSATPSSGLRQYRVVSGDSMMRIAGKFTGDQQRWRELLVTNPHKRSAPDRLAVGELLAIPPTWPDVPGATTAPAPPPVVSLPPLTTPAPPQAAQNATVFLQAKATLAAWAATDGRSEIGATGYGSMPDDVLPTWGARDVTAAATFERWSNRFQGTALVTDGAPDDELFAALRLWVERRASGQTAPVPPIGVPSVPQPPPVPPVPQPPIALPPIVAAPTTPAQPPAAAPVPAEKKSSVLLPLGIAGAVIYALNEL